MITPNSGIATFHAPNRDKLTVPRPSSGQTRQPPIVTRRPPPAPAPALAGPVPPVGNQSVHCAADHDAQQGRSVLVPDPIQAGRGGAVVDFLCALASRNPK
jgi:hypothetical protein